MPLSGEKIDLLFNCLPGFGERLGLILARAYPLILKILSCAVSPVLSLLMHLGLPRTASSVKGVCGSCFSLFLSGTLTPILSMAR